jgi:hypothetical protein
MEKLSSHAKPKTGHGSELQLVRCKLKITALVFSSVANSKLKVCHELLDCGKAAELPNS